MFSNFVVYRRKKFSNLRFAEAAAIAQLEDGR